MRSASGMTRHIGIRTALCGQPTPAFPARAAARSCPSFGSCPNTGNAARTRAEEPVPPKSRRATRGDVVLGVNSTVGVDRTDFEQVADANQELVVDAIVDAYVVPIDRREEIVSVLLPLLLEIERLEVERRNEVRKVGRLDGPRLEIQPIVSRSYGWLQVTRRLDEPLALCVLLQPPANTLVIGVSGIEAD